MPATIVTTMREYLNDKGITNLADIGIFLANPAFDYRSELQTIIVLRQQYDLDWDAMIEVTGHKIALA